MQQRQHKAFLKTLDRLDLDLSGAPPEPKPDVALPFKATRSGRSTRELAKLREKRGGQAIRTADELPKAPDVNALSFMIRLLPGGRERFLEFVKLAALNGDVVADAFWTVYADLAPSNRNRVSFDDICAAAGIKPSALLAGVVGHGVESQTDMATLIAASLHPEMIAKAGESGLRISGRHAEIAAEDRKQFLQAKGFFPVAKGASIHLHANASATAAAASKSEPSVPAFADDLSFLRDSVIEVQALPPGSEE